MEKQKNEKSPQQKPALFRPDRKYIKNALEEYESRGGTITKIGTKLGYYSAIESR